MIHNKLVRDNIPAIIKKNGEKLVFHIAKKEEYWKKLKEKLAEEVIEFFKSESAEELADITEVLQAIASFKKITPQKLKGLVLAKRKKRGAFKKRIILDEV